MKHVQLSEHFSLAEFTRSDAAKRDAILNIPNEIQIRSMGYLCDTVLELVRRHFARPVIVLSGFRSPELNASVGGRPKSQHMRGEAADIMVAGVPHWQVFEFIAGGLVFDQLIAERLREDDDCAGWIHVSTVAGKKRQEAISYLGDNKYVSGLRFV